MKTYNLFTKSVTAIKNIAVGFTRFAVFGKKIAMVTTLTAGIISAMADSPDFTWFIASKIIAVFFFVLFFILAGWERLAETTAGKKIGTFFESAIDNVVDLCCFLVIDRDKRRKGGKKKIETFFESAIDNVVDLCCFLVIDRDKRRKGGKKKIETFFESIIDSVVDLCCFLAIDVVMLIGVLICAVIVIPIAAGFVLWLIAGRVYKKIFS